MSRLGDVSVNVRKKAFMLTQLLVEEAGSKQAEQIMQSAAAELLPMLCKMQKALPSSPLGAAEHQKARAWTLSTAAPGLCCRPAYCN